jgi:hypothetical protein
MLRNRGRVVQRGFEDRGRMRNETMQEHGDRREKPPA